MSQNSKRRGTQTPEKPAKKTRVSRACDQCRLAREKCDGTEPCTTCGTSRRACTYTAVVKKRGIQPGYIRALELALAYLFQHDPTTENLINEKLAQGALLSRDTKESRLHRRWRKTRFYNDVDKLLAGGGHTREEAPELPDSDDEQSDTEEPPPAVIHRKRELQAQINTTKPSAIPSLAPNTLVQMPIESWKLLELYFTHIHICLPVSEKHDMLKIFYAYPGEGLLVGSDIPHAGSHAELWSILAVASLHQSMATAPGVGEEQFLETSTQLYATARSLVPENLANIELGHVKALLNLAMFNLAKSSIQSAWLLVALGSRILKMAEQSLVDNPRYKHTVYACFILDSLLALYFDRRPYLHKDEVRQLGKLDEDGMDEWQPWSGSSHLALGQQSRTPLLTLSTFSHILDLVSLFNDHSGTTQDKLRALEEWEAELPPKLAHVCATTPPTSLTPPAVLIQLTYHCVAFTLRSSQSWLLRLLNLMDRAQKQIGWQGLPPMLRCLLDFICKRTSGMILNSGIQSRIQEMRVAMNIAWPASGPATAKPISTAHAMPLGKAINAVTMAPLSTAPSDFTKLFSNAYSRFPQFNSVLSDADIAVTTLSHRSELLDTNTSSQLDHRFPDVTTDLESFFDELASLDSASNLDNQPQFMQNLGFAPDSNMADLFSDYIPTQSSTFMSQGQSEAVELDHYGFYHAN